ncbi:MAG: 50S ribosomal protein L44e [Candidatus Micrarchaeota archaeon]|nr:50S ribosomal protein L44e [Candidatus Micrarchaeota archaeon]
MAYCPKCNKHTGHMVRMPSKGAARSMSKMTRRHNRATAGFVGSVEPRIHPKKLSKRQVILLECKVCKYKVERQIGGRSKKKVEIKV